MNNGRYVDKHTIIKRVHQYYGLDATGSDVEDFIYDGLRGIGGRSMYDLIATTGIDDMPNPIEVSQYRGVLPNNIEYPMHVMNYDTGEPLLCKDSIFRTDYMYNPYNANKTYKLNRNHIFTSEESINLILIYLGFPLSGDGSPLIPDNEHYLKAITAYVAMSLARPLYIKKQLDNRVFQMIEQDYYAQSYGTVEMEMPNEDEMEMLKNQTLQLLPDYTQWSDNFRTMGMYHRINHV